MIFVCYKPGSKGYQFWDAAHHCIEISRDVKFNEAQFPAKEVNKNQASTNDLPISESDNDSDQSGLELVIPAHPSPTAPIPGHSASGSQNPSAITHPNPPIAPPAVQSGSQPSGSGPTPAGPVHPIPRYSLRPTKEHIARQQPSGDSINAILANMFQEVPNSYREAMNSEDSDKWQAASQEEFNGLIEMGVWRLVDRPSDRKTIKCRWTYILKADRSEERRVGKEC